MRKCCLALCLLLSGILAESANAAEKVTKGWHKNYSKAYFEAKRLGLPLVVHFYTDWCGPCQQMEASVLNTAEVTAKLGRTAVGVKINGDHHEQLLNKFRIEAYPSDVYVDPNGKILFRRSGFANARSYASQLIKANKQVDVRSLAAAGAKPTAPVAGPILNGYSPVAITKDHKWQKGSSKFAWKHAGSLYHLQNAAELALFKANPQRYLPELAGHDPLELSTGHRGVPGDIRFGAFFRGKLYLLSNDENRKQFLSEPQRIAEAAAKLKMTDVSRPTAKM
ncbi:MAG: thioredoxin family protein [Planctomycetaceae bacterium]|jgi:thiol-disulfide isomerase/thioredoxin/YHS domain-containing protein|nr:thioredoxin family protein [Planctomycetaceae bacterium]MBT6485881.1 thioredoxin family protein [Planctomycetaceae bacterium]MBT6493453.1 thioredoxin family protein [Planctomycetaceae bacterium]